MGQRHAQRAAVDALDGQWLRAPARVQAAGGQLVGQVLAHVFIEATQRQRAPMRHHHLAAQALKDAGEFQCDETTAHHQQPLRPLRQTEAVVRRDGQFGTGHSGPLRPCTGGHDDARRSKFAPGHLHQAGADQARRAIDELDTRGTQQMAVNHLEP